MDGSFYTVGVITGTHGLRGEVKVLSRTDFEEIRFKPGAELWLRRPGEAPWRQVTVRGARRHKQWWLVSFEGLPSISDVEAWKGMELCVHESQLVPLPAGTYYLHQLIGLRVVTDDGRWLGELRDVLTPGANDVYVVRHPQHPRDLLLPAIPDCILDVNLDAGVMTVHLLPGLLDDETAGRGKAGRDGDEQSTGSSSGVSTAVLAPGTQDAAGGVKKTRRPPARSAKDG
ncbi:MAG: ribosome maturation factor RimM [Alicyclobacillaceae bacterium]|nr:ribosome maturation factor RimM [Alicyclobacillaceae bacterium]